MPNKVPTSGRAGPPRPRTRGADGRPSRGQGQKTSAVSALLLGLGIVVLVGLAAVVFWPRAAQAPASTQGSASADSGAPGRLVATQSTIDLGSVPFDKMVEAKYELTNTGGSVVRILGAPLVKTVEGC